MRTCDRNGCETWVLSSGSGNKNSAKLRRVLQLAKNRFGIVRKCRAKLRELPKSLVLFHVDPLAHLGSSRSRTVERFHLRGEISQIIAESLDRFAGAHVKVAGHKVVRGQCQHYFERMHPVLGASLIHRGTRVRHVQVACRYRALVREKDVNVAHGEARTRRENLHWIVIAISGQFLRAGHRGGPKSRGSLRGPLGIATCVSRRLRHQLLGAVARKYGTDNYRVWPHNAISALMVRMIVRVHDEL